MVRGAGCAAGRERWVDRRADGADGDDIVAFPAGPGRAVKAPKADVTAAAAIAPPEGTEPPRASSQSAAFLRYESPEVLFRACYAELVRALAFAWGGDVDAAADAVQDAFAELLVHWRRVSTYDEPAAWVRRVAINRLRSRRRVILRRASVLVRLAPGHEAHEPPPSPPDELTARLRTLPERQRTAVALHYVGGLTVVEVAEAMGISSGAVHRHLFRARAALRPMWEEDR